MDSGKQSVTQRRSKYGRPCDSCSLRKVKCDKTIPCSRCIKYNLPCTNCRETRKRGPKSMRPKTIDNIMNMHEKIMKMDSTTNYTNGENIKESETKNDYFQPQITLAELLPYLQVYQTWYYEMWPVLSVSQLTSNIFGKENSCKLDLNPQNIQSYTLCCALAGAIKEQTHYISSYNEVINIPKSIKSVDFIGECFRTRNYCDYRVNPTIDTILISFFLHVYYMNVSIYSPPAILHLREAISIAEILGLHDQSRYKDTSKAERNRLQNIYYMLLVSERFTCIDANLPAVLDANLPYTSTIDDGNLLFGGFSEIVKIFALPDKSFFINRFNNCALNNPRFSKQLMSEIQEELANIKIQDKTPEVQKLNILLSKSWMRLLIWNLCKTNKLVTNDAYGKDFFNNNFPIKVAREFLSSTQNLPLYAFETNGLGVNVKLIEIAEGLSTILNKRDHNIGYDILTSILNVISKLNNNMNVSTDIYERVQRLATNKRFTSLSNCNISNFDQDMINSPEEMPFEMNSKIQMINDDENVESNDNRIDNLSLVSPITQNFLDTNFQGTPKWVPLSQLSMAFNLYSNTASPNFGVNDPGERHIYQNYTIGVTQYDSPEISREDNYTCENFNRNYDYID